VAALNPIEDFTEKMSEEVAEGRINSSAEGMVSLLSQVLNGAPNATEKLAGACYIRSLQRRDVIYGTWPKLDRTNN
jgi:hypothetical protein